MTYLNAALVILLSSLSAACASWAIGRFVSIDRRRNQHAIGVAIFSQVGVMLSVLLAFVFSQVWGEYRTAAMAISGECAALHGAAMLSSALPGDEGQPVIRAIQTYADSVVHTEWPLMAHRQRSRQAAHDLENALRQAASLPLVRPMEVATQDQVINLLVTAHANRESRTFQLTAAAPLLLWVMLIVVSATLVIFVVCAGVERPTHMIFAAVSAGSVTMVLVLVRMLDLPFEGALALPPDDFVKLLSQVSIMVTAPG